MLSKDLLLKPVSYNRAYYITQLMLFRLLFNGRTSYYGFYNDLCMQ